MCIIHTAIYSSDVPVSAGIGGYLGHTVRNAIKIDFYIYTLFDLFFFIFPVFFFLFVGCGGLFVFKFHHIVFGFKRRRCIFGQCHQIHFRHVLVSVVPFRPAIGGIECAGRGEVEIFAVGAEGRITGVEPLVGERRSCSISEIVNVDAADLLKTWAHICQPFAVGRPGVRAELAVVDFLDKRYLFCVDVDNLQAFFLIAPGYFLAVGRPRKAKLVGVGILGELHRWLGAVMFLDVNLIAAAHVADVGNPFAIGRPLYCAVVRAIAVGKVVGDAVFDGRREDVAAAGQCHAFAVGRG